MNASHLIGLLAPALAWAADAPAKRDGHLAGDGPPGRRTSTLRSAHRLLLLDTKAPRPVSKVWDGRANLESSK